MRPKAASANSTESKYADGGYVDDGYVDDGYRYGDGDDGGSFVYERDPRPAAWGDGDGLEYPTTGAYGYDQDDGGDCGDCDDYAY